MVGMAALEISKYLSAVSFLPTLLWCIHITEDPLLLLKFIVWLLLQISGSLCFVTLNTAISLYIYQYSLDTAIFFGSFLLLLGVISQIILIAYNLKQEYLHFLCINHA
jgi:hypothetical protein